MQKLQPIEIWNNFSNLNAIPRASKKEQKVIQFIKNFGEKLNLPVIEDEVGNVIIKKPASPGMENRLTVCLQSHLDMVHQKNAETNFDFDTQGIQMYVDGDWLKADGTTLGADNGIGVAAIMSILASNEIQHPPLEALFTIDEETGMTGALGLKGGMLDAKILLNLDTEEDNELTIGCAGGIDVTGSGKYSSSGAPLNSKAIAIYVKGLTGGHSGIDIHRGRANANKLIVRILLDVETMFQAAVKFIDGGGLRNAIPRESSAVIFISNGKLHEFKEYIKHIESVLQHEYKFTDPNLKIIAESYNANTTLTLDRKFQYELLRVLNAIPNGISRMDSNIEGLVQTSNNLSRILVRRGDYSIQNLTRGSIESEKMDLAHTLKTTMELIGAKVSFTGGYPGWTPNPHANIVQLMVKLYKEMYHDEPLVNACHAGLECGILGSNYPDMEMISFGPTIRGAHSPDEKVNIASVVKFWDFLLATLKQIPQKN